MLLNASFPLMADKQWVRTAARVLLPHGYGGAEAVHVDVSVLSQLLSKLRCQSSMVARREVAQCVPQGQLVETDTQTISEWDTSSRWLDADASAFNNWRSPSRCENHSFEKVTQQEWRNEPEETSWSPKCSDTKSLSEVWSDGAEHKMCYVIAQLFFGLSFGIIGMRFLTRSSSAVRSGVLMGACGRPRSLPLLGGSGSRGSPLHRSFREHILLCRPSVCPLVCLSVWTCGDSERLHASLEDFRGSHCLSLAGWSSLPFGINQWGAPGR